MVNGGQGFVAFLWFGSSLTPIPLPSASCPSFSIFLCVTIRAYWRERGREGGGRAKWANHETPRKAWSSINHSILYGCNPGINMHIKLGNTGLGSPHPPPPPPPEAACAKWLQNAEKPGWVLQDGEKGRVFSQITAHALLTIEFSITSCNCNKVTVPLLVEKCAL